MLRKILAVAGERGGFQPPADGGVARERNAADRQWRYDFEVEQNETPLLGAGGEKQLIELVCDLGGDQVGRRQRQRSLLLAICSFKSRGFFD